MSNNIDISSIRVFELGLGDEVKDKLSYLLDLIGGIPVLSLPCSGVIEQSENKASVVFVKIENLQEITSYNFEKEPFIVLISDQEVSHEEISLLESSGNSILNKSFNKHELSFVISSISDYAKRCNENLINTYVINSFGFNNYSKLFPLINILFKNDKITKYQKLKLDVACQEAIANSIEHGNLELDSSLKDNFVEAGEDEFTIEKRSRLQKAPYKDRSVYIETSASNGVFGLKIIDEGKGFENFNCEVGSVVSGGLSDDNIVCLLERPYGRGFSLISDYMDSVEYRDQGREIIICFNYREN